MKDNTIVCYLDNGNEISVSSELTANDLIRLFVLAFKGEAYFPKSAKRACMDLAIEYMKREPKSSQDHEKHLIGKQTLADIVFDLIDNPPGLRGVQCELGHIGNKYVDEGWKAGLLELAFHSELLLFRRRLKANGGSPAGEDPDSDSATVE
jgi:hypothetical protein